MSPANGYLINADFGSDPLAKEVLLRGEAAPDAAADGAKTDEANAEDGRSYAHGNAEPSRTIAELKWKKAFSNGVAPNSYS
jgi:hypothetical protein